MMEDRRNRNLAWLAIAALGLSAAIAWLVVRPDRQDEFDADAGQLTEITYRRPDDVPRLDLADSTSRWNLSRPVGTGASIGSSHGGLAMADLDLDGDLDLVAADVADVDGASWPDLLVARSGPTDAIVWGGDWVSTATDPDMTELEGSQPSAPCRPPSSPATIASTSFAWAAFFPDTPVAGE
jgi:hypothetical protein